jgi:hypothetical protein
MPIGSASAIDFVAALRHHPGRHTHRNQFDLVSQEIGMDAASFHPPRPPGSGARATGAGARPAPNAMHSTKISGEGWPASESRGRSAALAQGRHGGSLFASLTWQSNP